MASMFTLLLMLWALLLCICGEETGLQSPFFLFLVPEKHTIPFKYWKLFTEERTVVHG